MRSKHDTLTNVFRYQNCEAKKKEMEQRYEEEIRALQE